jgi:thymidylate synthase
LDRVGVENFLRPDYSSYVNLNTNGIKGDMHSNTNAWDGSGSANKWQKSRNDISGNYGNQWGSTNNQTCGMNSYENAMSQTRESYRKGSRY